MRIQQIVLFGAVIIASGYIQASSKKSDPKPQLTYADWYYIQQHAQKKAAEMWAMITTPPQNNSHFKNAYAKINAIRRAAGGLKAAPEFTKFILMPDGTYKCVPAEYAE